MRTSRRTKSSGTRRRYAYRDYQSNPGFSMPRSAASGKIAIWPHPSNCIPCCKAELSIVVRHQRWDFRACSLHTSRQTWNEQNDPLLSSLCRKRIWERSLGSKSRAQKLLDQLGAETLQTSEIRCSTGGIQEHIRFANPDIPSFRRLEGFYKELLTSI